MVLYVWNAAPTNSRAALVEKRIRSGFPDVISVDGIEDIVRRAADQAGQLAFVLAIAPSEDKGFMASLLDLVSQHRGRLFFILVDNELSASDYKALVRTGGADWVSAGADPKEILDIIARAGRTASPSTSGRAGPLAVSFIPSAGGTGNSTLVVETAFALKTAKATRNLSICIIDLDFQGSHVCDYLDIEPRLRIEEISANPERLDAQLFDIFISRHPSGLHVFAAPRAKFDICTLNVLALDALFDMAAERYELILVDFPVTWFSWTRQVIGAMDGNIVTGLNSVPGLRLIAETLGEVRHAARASSQIAVAVNRCERGLLGGVTHRHHVERVLPDEKVFFVGNEPAALQSINIGRPMVLGRASRRVTKDIAAIAAFCEALRSVRAPRE